jgi:hypothetical protein
MPVVIKTKSFNENFLQLSSEEQKQTIKALRFLAENPRHPSLKTHKVKGTVFIEAYANLDIRIIFERTSDTIILRAVGRHNILKDF